MAVLLAPVKARGPDLAIPSAVPSTPCEALGLKTVFVLYHAAAVQKFELEPFSRKLPAVARSAQALIVIQQHAAIQRRNRDSETISTPSSVGEGHAKVLSTRTRAATHAAALVTQKDPEN